MKKLSPIRMMIIASLIVPTTAYAANWVLIGDVPAGKEYLDMDSIRHKGKITTFNQRVVFPAGRGVMYMSYATDCDLGIVINRGVKLFSADGKLINEQDGNNTSFYPKGSLAHIANTSCKMR